MCSRDSEGFLCEAVMSWENTALSGPIKQEPGRDRVDIKLFG